MKTTEHSATITDHAATMKLILDELFRTESPPGGDGAFMAGVTFRSGHELQGVLARVTIGHWEALKIAVPATRPHATQGARLAQKVMTEHYFDYEDLERVTVVREIDASKLAGDGPSIILGG